MVSVTERGISQSVLLLPENYIAPGEDALMSRIASFDPQSQSDITFALGYANHAFKGQFRKSGEPAVTHSIAVAAILIDVGIKDPYILAAALLHDVPEDVELKGDTEDDIFYDESGVSKKIRGALGHKVDNIVGDLTMLENPQGKADSDKGYYAQLDMAYYTNPEALLIKMADRLHNLWTLGSMLPVKQRRKIAETKNVYYPLFRQMLESKYAKPAVILFNQIHQAVAEIES